MPDQNRPALKHDSMTVEQARSLLFGIHGYLTGALDTWGSGKDDLLYIKKLIEREIDIEGECRRHYDYPDDAVQAARRMGS